MNEDFLQVWAVEIERPDSKSRLIYWTHHEARKAADAARALGYHVRIWELTSD